MSYRQNYNDYPYIVDHARLGSAVADTTLLMPTTIGTIHLEKEAFQGFP